MEYQKTGCDGESQGELHAKFNTGRGSGSRMTCHVSRTNHNQCRGGYLNVSPLAVHGTARVTACLLAESTGLAPGTMVQ
jgi:hypothetical protein